MLISLAGCNGDIFVDDYMPKEHDEITISETNNSKEINFKSDNWGLINIFSETFELEFEYLKNTVLMSDLFIRKSE